jgi:tetratricopeptide (TPR) repeat protein
MAANIFLVSALLLQGAPATVVVEAKRDTGSVGYEELMHGDARGAIARIEGGQGLADHDPAALINLGSAHARLGRRDMAREFYTAAIKSDDPQDLELADGRWMDSRLAARMAIKMLDEGREVLALR